ncbi:hypothetical protein MJ561_05280 [Klebsiella pneumoniae]|nr:hypothetical protein MJ561_05280 [Klebsiella pneumoniae]
MRIFNRLASGAGAIMKRFQPDVVLGMGAAFPGPAVGGVVAGDPGGPPRKRHCWPD